MIARAAAMVGEQSAVEAAGFDAARLDAIEAMLQGLVDAGRMPGAVALVMRHDAVAMFGAIGVQDPSTQTPMRRDSIFRIFSMTKPIVSVAAMRLVEDGRLLLTDPVAKHLPEFADVRVQVERDGASALEPPKRPMTVQDLLRHTAGFTYEFFEPSAVRRLYAEAGIASLDRGIVEHLRLLASLPLMHEPGSAWYYSRATDVLGGLVEKLTGETLGAHLRRTIFDPLGMVDTGFHVAPEHATRIAEPFPIDPESGAAVRLGDARRPRRLESGGGGLQSTAADYARFLRMLLAGGSLDGVRLLGPKTVEFMTADHLGTIPNVCPELPAGYGFGLGFAVKLATGVTPVPGSIGTYGWGGIAGTLFFVDPKERLIALLMFQAPGQRPAIQERFRNMVYAAIAR